MDKEVSSAVPDAIARLRLRLEAASAQAPAWPKNRRALLAILDELEANRREVEQAKQEWLRAVDAIHDPIFMHDPNDRIVRSNRAYAERAGLSVQEVVGKRYWEVFPRLDGPLSHCRKALQQEEENEEEEEIQTASGEIFLSRSFAVRNGDGRYLYSLHIMEDISERKHLQQALQESEEKFHQICATAQDAIVLMDDAGRISYWNQAAEKIFGYAAGEALGRELHALIVPERFRAAFSENFPTFVATGSGALIGKTLELAALAKDRTEFPIDLSITAAPLNGRWHAIGFVRDISERKRSEQALLRLNRTLKTLSAGNQLLLHVSNEQQLLQAMCQVLVDTGGYRAAWVGYVQHDAGKTVRPMAQSGFAAGELATLTFSWADKAAGQSPSSGAVRSGRTEIAQDIAQDPRYASWRTLALQHGFKASIALPLRDGGAVLGNLSIYAGEINAFNPAELGLLEEMADDLAFGIRMLRLRQEQQRGAEQVRLGLEGTVQVIAAMVEMRDPYTAGHQRRVADLAATIAQEMGLPQEQVHGIHLAGTIHDLGKIRIPSEILSKPGKLSAVEFNLVKEHPGHGYDILKEIRFPWPIADMVLQHHERLDGSGYPQGLTGQDILLEARILAVADVVEAITSHRPYRPAIGIKTALAEIENHRGGLYDPAAVDLCLRLFRKQGYTLIHTKDKP